MTGAAAVLADWQVGLLRNAAREGRSPAECAAVLRLAEPDLVAIAQSLRIPFRTLAAQPALETIEARLEVVLAELRDRCRPGEARLLVMAVVDAVLPVAKSPVAAPPASAAEPSRSDDRGCRYPSGDPKSWGFAFCGAPKSAGRSYCEAHHAIAFGRRPTGFERRAEVAPR